jgi:outer membrane lipoprotein-sorting protein
MKRRPMKCRIAVALLALWFMAVSRVPAMAQEAAGMAADLQRADLQRADLQRIESYLNGLTTLSARLTQIAEDGRTATAMLYISRPGRMRLEYDPPSPVLMVATGTFLVYFDKSLKQVSYIPISSTPAWLFLRETVSLTGEVKVTEIAREAGTLRATVIKSDEPDAGAITLLFTEAPFQLRQWTVRDSQGSRTRITLSEVTTGMALDRRLFEFQEPEQPPDTR